MHPSRHFYNEKLPTRTESLFQILFTVMFFFLIAMLAPYLRPQRHSTTGISWTFASILSVIFILISLFEKIFVSIHFDYENKVINITSKTILEKDKTQAIPFDELKYREGKESSRLKQSKILELYNGTHRVIKLKANIIGEYTFSEISKEIISLDT